MQISKLIKIAPPKSLVNLLNLWKDKIICTRTNCKDFVNIFTCVIKNVEITQKIFLLVRDVINYKKLRHKISKFMQLGDFEYKFPKKTYKNGYFCRYK